MSTDGWEQRLADLGQARERVEDVDGRCKVGGCDGVPRARNYCSKHYQRARRHREFTPATQRPRDCDMRQLLLDRSSPADDGSDCRRWTGWRLASGYGRIKFGGRDRQAHAVAYELWVGPIPEGHEIDHVAARGCRHRDCINVDHLEAVTHAENCRRIPQSPTCPSGHEMSGHNLRIKREKGGLCRYCRTCLNAARRRQRAGRQEARSDG